MDEESLKRIPKFTHVYAAYWEDEWGYELVSVIRDGEVIAQFGAKDFDALFEPELDNPHLFE